MPGIGVPGVIAFRRAGNLRLRKFFDFPFIQKFVAVGDGKVNIDNTKTAKIRGTDPQNLRDTPARSVVQLRKAELLEERSG